MKMPTVLWTGKRALNSAFIYLLVHGCRVTNKTIRLPWRSGQGHSKSKWRNNGMLNGRNMAFGSTRDKLPLLITLKPFINLDPALSSHRLLLQTFKGRWAEQNQRLRLSLANGIVLGGKYKFCGCGNDNPVEQNI